MHPRSWAQARGRARILAIFRQGIKPATRLNAVVVGHGDAGIFRCDRWRQWWHRLAQLLHTLVTDLICVDAGVAAPNGEWIGPVPTNELASRECVPTNDAVVVLPTVTRHLARRRDWLGCAYTTASRLRGEVVAPIFLASSGQTVAAVLQGGALERRGRGSRDLGLASLHGHRRANGSVRTNKSHIRRAITASDVIVARVGPSLPLKMQPIKVAFAPSETYTAPPASCDVKWSTQRAAVIRKCSVLFAERTGAVLPWNVQLKAAKEPSTKIAPPCK
jgi:hypothetical protein